MRSSTSGWLTAAVAAAALAGCASTDVSPPKAEFARAELAIKQAVAADATEYAPLHLREARQKLEQAREALHDENFTIAGRLADEAQVSAELAMAEAQSARAEQLAEENRRSIEVLREELQRREGTQ